MARSSRRTREDLKNLILDAAAEVVERDGIGVMSSTVTYQQVFDHLEQTHGIRVTRGSVHERIWESQRAFQLDVLRRAGHWDASDSTDQTIDVAAEVFEQGLASGWSSDRILTEIVRLAGAENYRAAEDDDFYLAWLGLTLAIAQTLPPDSDEYLSLARAVIDSYGSLTNDFTHVFGTFLDTFGARVRPDLFIEPEEALAVFTKLATAVSEGISLRRRFDDEEFPDVQLTTGPDGALETWHPFSLGLLALVRLFIEISPDDNTEPSSRQA